MPRDDAELCWRTERSAVNREIAHDTFITPVGLGASPQAKCDGKVEAKKLPGDHIYWRPVGIGE